MSPRSTPNASSRILTIGTKQFVVQDAFEMILCCSRSKVSSFTPTTNVASAFFAGADTMTSGAPASRCMAALSRSVNSPDDSTTRSTSRSFHGSAFGSRSDRICNVSPLTLMPSPTTSMSASQVPRMESYFSRCAMSSTDRRSLAATKSMSAPRSLAARKKLRPMRPNPLIPTFTAIGTLLHRMRCACADPIVRTLRGWGHSGCRPRGKPAPELPSSVPVHVPMLQGDRIAAVGEVSGEVLGHHHRAVAAPRATDPDREVGLSLRHIPGHHRVEQAPELLHERAVLRLAGHVLPDPAVGARKGPELVDPVGVGEESHVEHQVGVPWPAVLEPERNDSHLERGLGGPFGEYPRS